MQESIQLLILVSLITLAGFILVYCFRLHYEVSGIRTYYK